MKNIKRKIKGYRYGYLDKKHYNSISIRLEDIDTERITSILNNDIELNEITKEIPLDQLKNKISLDIEFLNLNSNIAKNKLNEI